MKTMQFVPLIYGYGFESPVRSSLTILDVPGGSRYTLQSINEHYPIMVVFKGGAIKGYTSVKELATKEGIGWRAKDEIQYIGFLKTDRTVYGDRQRHVVLDINGESFKVSIIRDTYGWRATEESYDGPEDKYRMAHSFTSEAEALKDLRDQLEEWQRMWAKPFINC